MRTKYNRIISILLVAVLLVNMVPLMTRTAEATSAPQPLAGKTLSILGDSISTWGGISNGAAADTTNSTIRGNWDYYPTASAGNDVTYADTWWVQACEALGLELLVNNSWHGSCLYETHAGTVGAYIDRCVQLHDNTGDNAGVEPDIIAIYLGTNDYYIRHVYQGTPMGSVDAIDFANLYTEVDGVRTYIEPTNIFEAYAIIMDKISVRYPNSEVFCFTLLPEMAGAPQGAYSLPVFNANVKALAERYNAHVVDLYNCGMRSDHASFFRHMGNGADDALHPRALGMDAITNAVVSSMLKNSKYTSSSDYCKVTYRTSGNVLVEQGLPTATIKGAPFYSSLWLPDASNSLKVSVTMGGTDVTANYYNNGVINIPSVTGDLVIKVAAGEADPAPKRVPTNFRWEMQNDNLVSVTTGDNTKNTIYKDNGNISGGNIDAGIFHLSQAVHLNFDRPWSVEWVSSGNWANGAGGGLLFSSSPSSTTEGNRWFFRVNGNSIFAMGYFSGGTFYNYGVDISGRNLDLTGQHKYRLTNQQEADGSNMIYLYIDDELMGPMNRYYTALDYQGYTSNWVSGKNFQFGYLGTDIHPISDCNISYIQVWENGRPEDRQTTPESYRWEPQGSAMVSVTTDGNTYNEMGQLAGNINNGTLSGTRFVLGKTVDLLHDQPWTVEWRGSGDFRDFNEGGMLFGSSFQTTYLNTRFLYRGSHNLFVALGQYDENANFNYWGVSKDKIKVDINQTHTYRLTNRLFNDGSNMVYLYIDDVEVGPLNEYYQSVNYQGYTDNWISGKDFHFTHPGADPHPIGGCTLEYIQVWEGGKSLQDLGSKTISFLGDSITTFTNYSNGTAASTTNSTITYNRIHYPDAVPHLTVNDTWWRQSAEALGLKVLVNNSWSGSCMFTKWGSGTVGAYVDRCVQLHDDTGSNAGEEPDIIGIFLGTNDFYRPYNEYFEGDPAYDVSNPYGSFEAINFSTLITGSAGSYSYATPTTVMEAYAIALHKISIRYPNAEVYCCTLLPRIGDGTQPTDFNADIAQLVKYCNNNWIDTYVVDFYNSGITTQPVGFYHVMNDTVHPDLLGMDAMTGAFVSSVLTNSKYVSSSDSCDVSFDLTNVISEQGTPYAVVRGEPLEISLFALAEPAVYDVTVTMGGADITASCYANGKISIPSVTGDVKITAVCTSEADPQPSRVPTNFRWEYDPASNSFISASTGDNTFNGIHMYTGSISNGTLTDGRFYLEQATHLNHDRPWSVEWKSSGNWINGAGGGLLFSTAQSSTAEGNRWFFRVNGNSIFAMGYFSGGNFHNYGLDISRYNLDLSGEHIYRLTNKINADGTNMIYLYIDDQEMGAMDTYFLAVDPQGSSNWVSGKNFQFSYLGTDIHPLTDCNISYIQVWENGRPEQNHTSPENYRWEMQNNALVSVTTGNNTRNDLTLTQGGITDTGIMANAQYDTTRTVDLLHDRPWVVEWESAGDFNGIPYGGLEGAMLFGDGDSSVDMNNRFLYRGFSTVFLGLGYFDREPGTGSTRFHVAGIYKDTIDSFGIDVSAMHRYRLVNKINADGSNMVYLYIDGVEIGALDQYSCNLGPVGTTGWVSGKDFHFTNLGSAPHSLGGFTVNYIQVWESGPAYNYRWEMQNDSMVSVTTGNNTYNGITAAEGTSISGGNITSGRFSLDQTVNLSHERPWSVEWKSSGNWMSDSGGGLLFSANPSTTAEGNRWFFRVNGNSIFALGYYSNGGFYNYGVDVSSRNLDLSGEHTFRLTNRIAEDGSNMVYLYIDNQEMGAMNTFFFPIEAQGTSNWISGQDFHFTYLGTDMHPLTDCNISYIQVWENGRAIDAMNGKTISILGDSISTFGGISNGAAADTTNSTIRNNWQFFPYPDGGFTVGAQDTWWNQAAAQLGMRILVNNAWSGSFLYVYGSDTPGAYIDRCVQLHDDTGENAGEEPDIIAIFLGTNDYYITPDVVGRYDDINFDTLITGAPGSRTYATPTSSMEAYAIILDKIQQRYPNAEVYCFTLLPRIHVSLQPTDFNADLVKLANRFGVNIVDLYNSGIPADECYWSNYFGDNLHPQPYGMDCITGAFVSSVLQNSKYVSPELYNVTYNLANVASNHGTAPVTVAGEAFVADLTARDTNYVMDVTVTMGGVDITSSCYANGNITIPAVTGDIVITAKAAEPAPVADYTPSNYRWSLYQDAFTSVSTSSNTLNPANMLTGSIVDGQFSWASFSLERGVILMHDQPWTVEWKSSGKWSQFDTDGYEAGLLFNSAYSYNNNRYFYRREGGAAENNYATNFGIGYSPDGGHFYTYSVDISGIDLDAEHVFRLDNRIFADGSNMIYLFIDDVEIGPLTHYYFSVNPQYRPSNWLSGRNFQMPYIGLGGHSIGNCSLEYLQVWESGKPETLSVDVDITWGALEFSYTPGAWDPSTHTYLPGTWTPDENSNTIEVFNDGEVDVAVSYLYANAEGLLLTGGFSDGSAALTAPSQLNIGREQTAYLALSGKAELSNTYQVIGSVTVKLD